MIMTDRSTAQEDASVAALLGGRQVWRVSNEGVDSLTVHLPSEEPLAIEINGQTVAVLMRAPGQEKALAVGYCLSEGLIRSLGDIMLLHHCGSGLEDGLLPATDAAPLGPGNRVRLMLTPAAGERLRGERPARWVFSGCAGVDVATLGAELHVDGHDLRLTPDMLFAAVPVIGHAQDRYKETGGVHAAALFDADGRLLSLAEDVGRHNAADKAIGEAALAGRLPAAVLVATGRASSDIVAKAARVGIPAVASFSSSTSLGIHLAQAAGISLIGYLRRNRFTVYTHPERIAVGEGR